MVNFDSGNPDQKSTEKTVDFLIYAEHAIKTQLRITIKTPHENYIMSVKKFKHSSTMLTF